MAVTCSVKPDTYCINSVAVEAAGAACTLAGESCRGTRQKCASSSLVQQQDTITGVQQLVTESRTGCVVQARAAIRVARVYHVPNTFQRSSQLLCQA